MQGCAPACPPRSCSRWRSRSRRTPPWRTFSGHVAASESSTGHVAAFVSSSGHVAASASSSGHVVVSISSWRRVAASILLRESRHLTSGTWRWQHITWTRGGSCTSPLVTSGGVGSLQQQLVPAAVLTACFLQQLFLGQNTGAAPPSSATALCSVGPAPALAADWGPGSPPLGSGGAPPHHLTGQGTLVRLLSSPPRRYGTIRPEVRLLGQTAETGGRGGVTGF